MDVPRFIKRSFESIMIILLNILMLITYQVISHLTTRANTAEQIRNVADLKFNREEAVLCSHVG